MNWVYYPYYYYMTSLMWLVSFVFLFFKNNKISNFGFLLSIVGTVTISLFATILWIQLGRPPLRTLGETRLWYSIFLPLVGIVFFAKWKFRWFLQYSLFLAMVFLTINFLKPETHEKTLMPALQSLWFVPHVIVYIFAYALLAGASVVAVNGLYKQYKNKFEMSVMLLADNLVYFGFAFITLGLLFGALWAKEAWGDYWTWDPKETWAFITWMGYLVYMHFRYHQPKLYKTALWVLAFSFVVLLICWFGVNYLPSASNSVHVYSS